MGRQKKSETEKDIHYRNEIHVIKIYPGTSSQIKNFYDYRHIAITIDLNLAFLFFESNLLKNVLKEGWIN